MRSIALLLVAIAMTLLGATTGAFGASGPRELGWVDWGNDLDAARERSRATGRPVLVLFQEIPGCATCTGFGDGPLSNPLLIEAIETEFVPVAIHNNRPGRDAAILARYDEPAWNNPVMRFVDAEGRDVLPRRGELWSEHQVASRLVDVLTAARRPVPDYLRHAADETDLARQERVTLAMHCFWEGEAKLGGLEGVISTRAGFLDGGEVVEVTFHRDRVRIESLVDTAQAMSSATRVYAHRDDQLERLRARAGSRAARAAAPAKTAPDDDRSYHLNATTWALLPLTPFQVTRVNAALARGESPEPWLSPGQRELAARIRAIATARPDLLAGLARPEDPRALGAYRRRLIDRLAQTPSSAAARER